MEKDAFWDVTACSLVEVYRRFGANHCLIFREEAAQRTRELYRTDYTMSPPEDGIIYILTALISWKKAYFCLLR